MENLEKESFGKLESMNCEIEDIKELVSPMQEDCFAFTVESLDKWDLIEKYRTAQTMTSAIFKLLWYYTEETNRYINKVYKERKKVL